MHINMKYVYLIGLLIPSLLWATPEKERNKNVTLYEIKDKRFEKVLDEVMSDVHVHLSEMQYRVNFLLYLYRLILIQLHILTLILIILKLLLRNKCKLRRLIIPKY